MTVGHAPDAGTRQGAGRRARAHGRLAAVGEREARIHAQLADVARQEARAREDPGHASILERFAESHDDLVRSTREEVWAHRRLARHDDAGDEARALFVERALHAEPERRRLLDQSARARRILDGMRWRELAAIERAFRERPEQARRLRTVAEAHAALARLATRKTEDHLRLAVVPLPAAADEEEMRRAWAHRQLARRSVACAIWNGTCASPLSIAALLRCTLAHGSER
jgi:hypothetical protein